MPPIIDGIPHYWTLKDKIAVPCDMPEAARCLSDDKARIVGQTDIGPLHVSTVFLVFAHNAWGTGDPMLFETMVFSDLGAGAEEYCRRYFTWDEAEKGHEIACEWARERVAKIKETLTESNIDLTSQ